MKHLFSQLFQIARTQGDNRPAINSQNGPVSVTYGETTADADRRQRELLQAIAREKGLDPQLLVPILEYLGHRGLTDAQMREQAESAIAAIVERASQPVAPTNDGADIAAPLAAARARLVRVDTAGALTLLAGKIAEEQQARRQRLLPLLTEHAFIQRAAYDHAAAQATLRQMIALEPDNPWHWFALGDLLRANSISAAALGAYRNSQRKSPNVSCKTTKPIQPASMIWVRRMTASAACRPLRAISRPRSAVFRPRTTSPSISRKLTQAMWNGNAIWSPA